MMTNDMEKNVHGIQDEGKKEEQEQHTIVDVKSIEAQKVEEKINNGNKEEDVKKEEDNIVVVEEKNDGAGKEDPLPASGVEKNPIPPYKGDSDLLTDLREYEKKALLALRSKIEEAILENKLFDDDDVNKNVEEVKEKPFAKDGEEKEKTEGGEVVEGKKEDDEVEKMEGEIEKGLSKMEQINLVVEEEKGGVDVKDDNVEVVWDIPLLSSKGDNRTDVILLKFLRARDFNANNAFEMLKKTLRWRKDNSINSVIDEDFEVNYGPIAFMQGNDLEGHPICYNVCGMLGNEEMYAKILGSEEKREKFLRWRIQLMEKGVKKLDFKPRGSDADGGISTVVQVIDLKNTPLPTRKELRFGIRKAVELFQDNYPEFADKIIFINVPFWYYAFSALFAPSLTQRTKNKIIFARASRVTDTLLKYIAVEELPIQYGGLKRESDPDFNTEDTSKDITIKAGTTETVEIPAPEVGNVIIWDLTVSGWDVNYKEEFVPTDEKSYSIIVQRGRKITWQEGPIRNSFQNKEPGNIVITIENSSFKKKRILYRYKARTAPSSTTSS